MKELQHELRIFSINNYTGQKICSEETRRKLSESHKGKKNPLFGKHRSKETRKKISESNTGKIRSKETRKKISESKKGEKNYWFGKTGKENPMFGKTGKENPMFGKTGKESPMFGKENKWGHHSEETKKKISKATKGKNNPMFGKHWPEESKRKMREKRKFQIIPFKDTKPETRLQEALASKNIIFEKHKSITGQPDIFIEPNLCIFVDGCFWHNCPVHFNLENKYTIKRKARDEYVSKTLFEGGYKVLRFWEHEINNNIENCVGKINIEIEKNCRIKKTVEFLSCKKCFFILGMK